MFTKLEHNEQGIEFNFLKEELENIRYYNLALIYHFGNRNILKHKINKKLGNAII